MSTFQNFVKLDDGRVFELREADVDIENSQVVGALIASGAAVGTFVNIPKLDSDGVLGNVVFRRTR